MTSENELRHTIDDLQREVEQRKKELSVLEQRVVNAQKTFAVAEKKSEELVKLLGDTNIQIETVGKELQSLQNCLETRELRITELRLELENETNKVRFKTSSLEETT